MPGLTPGETTGKIPAACTSLPGSPRFGGAAKEKPCRASDGARQIAYR